MPSILENMKINPDLSPRTDEQLIESGLRLAKAPEKNGGWSEYLSGAAAADIKAICALPHSKLDEDYVTAQVAMLLENAKRWVMALDESQRAVSVGGFIDHLFPVIKTGFVQNPALNWASVQAMTKKLGTIYYMNYRYGNNKGAVAKGARIFDALAGYAGGHNYSSEVVENESVASTSATTSVSGTLAYGGGSEDQGSGIRPGTLVLNWVANDGVNMMVARDNANGVIVKDTVSSTGSDTISAGVINYVTGAFSFTASAATGSLVTATYEYDSEGSLSVPTVEVEVISTGIEAKRRALRYRYSAEASQDMSAELGRNVGDEIAEGVAATLATEQAREVIYDLWITAGAPYASFPITVPGGGTPSFTKREYFADIQYDIARTYNNIYDQTQKVTANFAIVDIATLNVLSAIGAPHFAQWQQAAKTDDGVGIKFAGLWENRIQVWVDPLLNQLPGASLQGNMLLGYRGSDFKDAGYVWAPYQLLYTTPTVTLDDFMTRRAMASRVGRKVVNPRMYKRMELTV